MINLTDSQLALVCQKIKEKNLTFHALEEELIDHYACLVEREMANGQSFTDAFEQILGKDKTDCIPLIQAETISLLTYKSSMLKKIGLTTCIIFMAACFVLSLFTNSNLDRPEIANTDRENSKIPEIAFNANAMKVVQIEPPSRSPLENALSVTSTFGMRVHPIYKQKKMHKGIDFRAPLGTPVYATADGFVEKVVTQYGYGKLIILKHDETYQTYYAQLSIFDVKEGQTVKKGDLIGKVGSSGLSTAPHLHYEVLKNGKPVNPQNYL